MANQKNIKISRPHFENLDALRFLAAFSVFIFHFFSELKALIPIDDNNFTYRIITFFTSKGSLGVNFFFVLSGFLITFLILFELKHKKEFNLKHFLIRRTLRIWPLYFIIILIGFVIFPLLFDQYQTEHIPLNYILFLANFDEIWHGANDSINFLTSPWSVAVEEQFYLVWGILLFGLSRLKILQLPTLITLLLIGSLLFRWVNSDDLRTIYYHTFSVMPDILIGALLANCYFNKANWIDKIKSLTKWKISMIYILGGLIILLKNKIFPGQLIVLERYVTAIFFAFILLDQLHLKHSVFKLGKSRLFNHLGKISYGLYMYHLVVFFVFHKIFTIIMVDMELNSALLICLFFIFGLAGTYIISIISYKWIEKPFLNLKKKFI